MLKFYKMLGNIVDMNWWANKIGGKLGLWKLAAKSPVRKWESGLTGWKWWTWQIVGGIIGLVVFEYLLNLIGLTIIPWR